MKQIRIGKVTLNVGAGKDQSKLERGKKLLKLITGIEPVQTATTKRNSTWGLRPNLPIGCKITIRKDAETLLKRLLVARDYTLEESNFDENGNLSFGVPEYIEIDGVEYSHDVGMMGLDVAVTLERPGYRVKRRSRKTSSVGKKHSVKKQEAIQFMKDKFGIKLGDEE
ncbi:MAG: 50S ribosomal protein L5 [Nanobdellota archaeon]